MTELIAGGAAGLLLGMAVQRLGLTNRDNVRGSIALLRRSITRRVLYGIGWAVALTALLGWLAVIDVDLLQVIPLHGGTVAGAIIFGAAAGLTGLQTGTAPAMIGGGRFLEGVCGTAGCLIGTMALPRVLPILEGVRTLLPGSGYTLFRVTLDEPYLLPGGFLALGLTGAGMMVVAMLIRPEPLEEPVQTAPEEEAPQEVSAEPETVQEETVVALLPGEEPLVVDSADGAGEESRKEEEEEERSETEQETDGENHMG
ncbi:MAG: hypothetical protein IJ507_09325 [Clostridia bacterium]|nr:hypothetical protein [Clostridia bacterium]